MTKTLLGFVILLSGCAGPAHEIASLGHELLHSSTELAKAAIERNKPTIVYYVVAPPAEVIPPPGE